MTLLVVIALVAGQPVFATHEFGIRAACEATRTLVYRELIARHADKIVTRCFEVIAI